MRQTARERAAQAPQPATGFDFTRHMRAVCADIVSRLPEFSHVDLSRVAVSFSQARKPGRYGLYASLTPMRFAHGALVKTQRGRHYKSQQLLGPDGREMLYILSFCLPRFMDVDFREKLSTIIHELWHIGPRFDGDIRRHEGRCYAHTGSKQRYDAAMQRMADRWLQLGAQETVYAFLRYNFSQLRRIHGRVFGVKVRHPKLIPITADEAARLEDLDDPRPAG